MIASQQPKLEDLENELGDVHGWVQLGLCLNVPKHALEGIHTTHGSGCDALRKCKAKMLSTWLEECETPTWAVLIAALQDTRKWMIATKIAAKYGMILNTVLQICCNSSSYSFYIYFLTF